MKENMFGLIAKHDKSSTTVKEFCQLHDLTQGVFYYWQKKYHLENSEHDDQGGFVQLQVADAPPIGAQQGLFAEVSGIRLYQSVPAAYLKELIREEVC